jgi:MFS transporter, DHA1 family, multidrug resistance protein
MNAQLSHAETKPHFYSERPLPATPHPRNSRHVMIALAVCMALQMTSFVMFLPLFARRFGELGAGVEALGTSAMAYALTSTLTAPFMGALADRWGRRPLVLLPLAVYILAFSGYLLASSATAFIVLRGLAGALTAGLMPAVTGIVADLAPKERRAQWIGVVSGGASVGWIAGPLLGGVFYDRWGYAAPFAVSIALAVVTFVTALLVIPETHRGQARTVAQAAPQIITPLSVGLASALRNSQKSLPPSRSTFVALLSVSFAVMFAWAFIEPKFMFYAYNTLGWSSSMLGLAMSTYGVAMTLGEFGLSRMSDHFGRKPIIVLGLGLFATQFMGLAFSQNYVLIALTFVIGGLGNALFDPALSAGILDIAPAEHQARILGLKATAGSLGNILGPACGGPVHALATIATGTQFGSGPRVSARRSIEAS